MNPSCLQSNTKKLHLHDHSTGAALDEVINSGYVVSKETVVLRQWGSSIQKFSFINGVDNVN